MFQTTTANGTSAGRVPEPKGKVGRTIQSKVDTLLLSPDIVRAWKNPLFQRDLKENAKVIELSEELRNNGGVFPGIITLGVLGDTVYLLDGQHRRAAFLMSEMLEGFADVRYRFFDTMAEMGEEFVKLNTQLVRLRPDDILRGLEGTSPALQLIKRRCSFIGYSKNNSTILGMSVMLRCWFGSATSNPVASAPSAMAIAQRLGVEDANTCANFAIIAEQAFGRDKEYSRLWSTLNLTLCAWLYRRIVVNVESDITEVTPEEFRSGLLNLTTKGDYLEWLKNRSMSERDRGPCYKRIVEIVSPRLKQELGKKRISLPDPEWVHEFERK